jgi:hypothetical protein
LFFWGFGEVFGIKAITITLDNKDIEPFWLLIEPFCPYIEPFLEEIEPN